VAKDLRLACWNANGVRGMRLEHFLSQHGVDICLLTETRLRDRDVLRLANYVCLRTVRPTEGGGTAILVRRGIDHYAVPVLGLTQLEATAIHIMLSSGRLKLLAVYLSLSRPIFGSDLSVCFGGGFPVLMAGDLNAKHVDWNSRLTLTRGELLRDYASGNSCLIYGPESPTTPPYISTATPDVLDIVITKDLTFAVYLTACSALSSDHLPVLIDATC
jgi:endonuclease/exonuclease/phosphatase (EEP) superfamily protein YafD